MTSSPNDVRTAWMRTRGELDSQARLSKDSQGALLGLSQRYRMLDDEQRVTVDGILAEWIVSDDESERFDALALVDEYRVRSALPALRVLAGRLENNASPGAPYEWAKVNRVIGRLLGGR